MLGKKSRQKLFVHLDLGIKRKDNCLDFWLEQLGLVDGVSFTAVGRTVGQSGEGPKVLFGT